MALWWIRSRNAVNPCLRPQGTDTLTQGRYAREELICRPGEIQYMSVQQFARVTDPARRRLLALRLDQQPAGQVERGYVCQSFLENEAVHLTQLERTHCVAGKKQHSSDIQLGPDGHRKLADLDRANSGARRKAARVFRASNRFDGDMRQDVPQCVAL